MILKTSRLDLFPLSWKELEYLTTNIAFFEKSVSYIYDGEEMTGILKDIFMSQIPKIKMNSKDYELLTFWMIVLRKKNTIIGSISFKGLKSIENSLELGYGLNKKYHNKGYITEAINAFIDYGHVTYHAEAIIAQTLRTNIASQKALLKNNFLKFKETQKYCFYKHTKDGE